MLKSTFTLASLSVNPPVGPTLKKYLDCDHFYHPHCCYSHLNHCPSQTSDDYILLTVLLSFTLALISILFTQHNSQIDPFKTKTPVTAHVAQSKYQTCTIWLSVTFPTSLLVIFPFGGSNGKEPACNAGDPNLRPGLGISPEGGNGYPLQYSCLENFMDRGA